MSSNGPTAPPTRTGSRPSNTLVQAPSRRYSGSVDSNSTSSASVTRRTAASATMSRWRLSRRDPFSSMDRKPGDIPASPAAARTVSPRPRRRARSQGPSGNRTGPGVTVRRPPTTKLGITTSPSILPSIMQDHPNAPVGSTNGTDQRNQSCEGRVKKTPAVSQPHNRDRTERTPNRHDTRTGNTRTRNTQLPADIRVVTQ